MVEVSWASVGHQKALCHFHCHFGSAIRLGEVSREDTMLDSAVKSRPPSPGSCLWHTKYSEEYAVMHKAVSAREVVAVELSTSSHSERRPLTTK